MNYIFSAIFLYFFLGFLLYIFQRRIIFNKSGHPGAPQDYNLTKTEEIYIKTEDNLDLLSWYHKGDNSLPLLVYFHGNSYHIGDSCLLYTSPRPRDRTRSRMPSSA